MDGPEIEFCRLLQRVREGSALAWQTLVSEYQGQVLRAVERYWDRRLAPVQEPVGLVQEVWMDFFRELAGQVFPSPEQLLAFLRTLAHNRILDALRHCTCRKCAAGPRDSLDELAPDSEDQPTDRTPGPVEKGAAHDTWDALLTVLSGRDRHILVLLSEGHTHAEAAARVGIKEKTVQRVLRRARTILAIEPIPCS